jgi:hypothetical protein
MNKNLAMGFACTMMFRACGGSGGDSPTTTPPAATAPSITAQPTNQTATAGATATFTVTATGAAPLSYQWQKGGTNITGATAASYTIPAVVTGDGTAMFSVVVSNSLGTVTSSTAQLTGNWNHRDAGNR